MNEKVSQIILKEKRIALKRITVLIVDDSPVVRDALESLLQANEDITVVGEAKNGVEAVTKAEMLQPKLILMDAQMPEMSGVEATRLLKQQMPDIKILFLAVHNGFIKEAMSAGADATLMKDTDRESLISTIRELCS